MRMRGFGVATAALGFGSLAAPLLGLLIRLRGSLLITGGGFAAAGLVPGVAAAVGPLAVAGAAGTVVECVSTEVLQRSVPDRVRAFSLGLADSVMVLAAMLGALVAPRLASPDRCPGSVRDHGAAADRGRRLRPRPDGRGAAGGAGRAGGSRTSVARGVNR